MKDKTYIYPRLPDGKDLGFIKVGGAGLANCMFTAARAYVLHKKHDFIYIEPTWVKFSIGPYIRKEKDKRHYFGFFHKSGISGLRKILLLNTLEKSIFKKHTIINDNEILIVEGLGNYFEDFIEDHKIVKVYFDKIIVRNRLKLLDEKNLSKVIGVHIRLGDFKSFRRTPLQWYIDVIKAIQENTNSK